MDKTIKIFEKFSSAQEIPYFGYELSYCDEPLEKSHLDEFFSSVDGLVLRDYFLFQESKKKVSKDSLNDSLESLFKKEVQLYLMDEDERYCIFEVELGVVPLGKVNYLLNQSFYGNIFREAKKDKTLSRNQLISIIDEFVEVCKNGSLEQCVKKANLPFYKKDPSLNYALENFSSQMTRKTEREVLSYLIYFSASKMMKIFDECQCMQQKDDDLKKTIQAHIRLEAEDKDSPSLSQIECAALTYLRAPILLCSEKRAHDGVRAPFDAFRMLSALDEFKLLIAESMGIFDVEKTLVGVNEDLCFSMFDIQYKEFSESQKNEFDSNARKVLFKVAQNQGMHPPWGFI